MSGVRYGYILVVVSQHQIENVGDSQKHNKGKNETILVDIINLSNIISFHVGLLFSPPSLHQSHHFRNSPYVLPSSQLLVLFIPPNSSLKSSFHSFITRQTSIKQSNIIHIIYQWQMAVVDHLEEL